MSLDQSPSQEAPNLDVAEVTARVDNYKSRTAAVVMAMTWGIFGVHKFYLRKPIWGVLYLLFFWTYIPALVGFIEGITYAATDHNVWNEKHNGGSQVVTERLGVIVAVAVCIALFAIIGILAAIALPAYQDYTVRAKMSGPLAQLAAVKPAVTEYAYTNQTWPASLEVVGSQIPPGTNTNGVSVEEGVIYADVKAATGLDGSVYLIPVVNDDGQISWKCGSANIEPRYLPANCR